MFCNKLFTTTVNQDDALRWDCAQAICDFLVEEGIIFGFGGMVQKTSDGSYLLKMDYNSWFVGFSR